MINKPVYRHTLALMLGLLLPLSISAEQLAQVQDWLHKMQRAAHAINYEGTFVYGQGSQLSSMRIIHRATPQGEQERLISMDGTGREVIRDVNKVTCIMPDSKAVVVEKSRIYKEFPPAFPMQLDNLAKHYKFNLAGTGKVAGRVTQRINIIPKDNYRYGHHLWVDNETGLLLKTHLINERGTRIEQFVFTQIKYLENIPDSLLMPGHDGKDFTWYEAREDESSQQVKSMNINISWLPSGFRQDIKMSKKLPNSVVPLEHVVVTDGLASVSIFIEEDIERDPANLVGGSHMGAVNVHGRNMDDYHITVVGEVPHRTVRKISKSVTYQPDQ